jgi:hypothetical protein
MAHLCSASSSFDLSGPEAVEDQLRTLSAVLSLSKGRLRTLSSRAAAYRRAQEPQRGTYRRVEGQKHTAAPTLL